MGSKHKLARMKRTYETRIERASEATRTLDEWLQHREVRGGVAEDILAEFGFLAINGWRNHHKTIYEVDGDLLKELLDSEVPEEEIPVDVLRRIPHNCPLFVLPEPLVIKHEDVAVGYEQFLLVPFRIDATRGWLNRPEASNELKRLFRKYRVNSITELPEEEIIKQALFIDGPESADEIKFLWFGKNVDDDTDQMITTQTIFLKNQKNLNLKEQLQSIVEEFEYENAVGIKIRAERDENWERIAQRQFAVAVALTLYVCSDEPDMADIEPPQELVRTKTLPPGLPSVKTLGIRIGSALRSHRQASSSTSGDGITRGGMPHVRKAHWHRFWTGPRNGDRKLIIKWLPPIPVNIDKGEIITTIRPVKSA